MITQKIARKKIITVRVTTVVNDGDGYVINIIIIAKIIVIAIKLLNVNSFYYYSWIHGLFLLADEQMSYNHYEVDH